MAEGSIGGTKMSDLPASSYAYCEPGDGAVGERCHFPIRDAKGNLDPAHVRNALARLSQSPFGEKARGAVEAAAKKLGIGAPAGKAWTDMKAEPLTSGQLEAWLAGERARRIMVVPFGGPLPGGKAGLGLDIDGEYFDADSDIYGDFPQLRASRERLVDWHHDDAGVPRGKQWMKGGILGRIDLDEQPSEMAYEGTVYEGIAADFWAKAGEQRLALIKALQARGTPIFGSTQAVPWAVQKASDGHLDVWPVYRHTISTSPQNTHAVVPSLKAILTADLPFDEVGLAALKAALVGLEDELTDLRTPSGHGTGAETGLAASEDFTPEQQAALDEVVAGLAQALPSLETLII